MDQDIADNDRSSVDHAGIHADDCADGERSGVYDYSNGSTSSETSVDRCSNTDACSTDCDYGYEESASDPSINNEPSAWTYCDIDEGAGPSQPRPFTRRSWCVSRCSSSESFDSTGPRNESTSQLDDWNPPKTSAAGEVPKNEEDIGLDPDYLQPLQGDSSRKISEFFPVVRTEKKGNKTTNKNLIKGYKKRILSELQLNVAKKSKVSKE